MTTSGLVVLLAAGGWAAQSSPSIQQSTHCGQPAAGTAEVGETAKDLFEAARLSDWTGAVVPSRP